MKTFILSVPNTNLFPFTIRPINIHSVQQAHLIRQAVADQVPVAIGFYMEGEAQSREVAGYGVAHIADVRIDGSLLMYVQGAGKVNISESTVISNGIITYNDVHIIAENYILDDHFRHSYVALSKYFANWIDKYILDPGQKDFFLKSLTGAKEVVAACATYLIRDFEIQYELMERVDINDQIEYLHRLMLSKQLIF
jgi:ATP-dependent Lon protease